MKSLAVETKEQIISLLRAAFPDRFKLFRFKCQNWSTGGSVEITWIDGPAHTAVANLLASIKEHTTIMISLSRHYSEHYILHVAREYCATRFCTCEMPGLTYPYSDGSAWMDNDYSKSIPYRKIFDEMQLLDERDLPALTYRPYLINDVQTPIRAWIVRRRDYSHGKYPDYAICREHSYTNYARKIFKVRRRLSAEWVEVVQYDSLRWTNRLSDLDDFIHFQQEYGLKEETSCMT